eukprot:SAG11_NODE_7228_length_1175_cov_1.054833_1_plen_108_part_00
MAVSPQRFERRRLEAQLGRAPGRHGLEWVAHAVVDHGYDHSVSQHGNAPLARDIHGEGAGGKAWHAVAAERTRSFDLELARVRTSSGAIQDYIAKRHMGWERSVGFE